jgi:predicted dehydrogenase
MATGKHSVLLVGIGGYGNIYLEELLRGCAEGRIELSGTVDPMPSGCRYLKELGDLQVPHFRDIGEFIKHEHADLAIISTPIHFHDEHTCQALAAGMSVLCEKPLAPTVRQALRMKTAESQSAGFVAIGYQWSFADPILALKRDLMEGRLGRPLRLRTLICWPRPESYFSRNNWAGRIGLPGNVPVLDSPANNAMAHYLHNMFFLLGTSLQSSAGLDEVCAELYRANNIENYDTVALRCRIDGGIPALFYATHAVAVNQGPILEYEFENGVVRLNAEQGNHLCITRRDGSVHDYGEILEYPHRGYFNKLWRALAALDRQLPISCTIESAMPHVVCVNGAQRPSEAITTFAEDGIEWTNTTAGRIKTVRGLQQALTDCYLNWALPAERGRVYSWAKPALPVSLRDCVASTGRACC